MKHLLKRLSAFAVCLALLCGILQVNAYSLTTVTDYTLPSYLGAIPVETVIAGDINGDGKVNNKDLTRLFQYLSDWDVNVVEGALDTNGDGKVNNKDLTRLFQYLSDWDVQIFPQVKDCEHTGGTATCSAKAVCEICGEEYGELNPLNHFGGTATYYQKAVCSGCGNEYGRYAQILAYDQLNDTQKGVYNTVYEAILNLNKSRIYLDEYIKSAQTGESDINIAFKALAYDKPDCFWMPRSYKVFKTVNTYTGKLTDICITFEGTSGSANGEYHISAKQKAQMQARLETVVNTIVAEAENYGTDFEKEIYLHDYLCENIVYNQNAADDPSSDFLSFTSYGALVNGYCVCEGYSRAMQLLCQRLDIPCGLITGTYLANVPVNSYICITCGNIYDASETGVSFDDLPDDYVCEICQEAKDNFVKYYTLFTLRCVCNKCGWYFDEDTRGVEWDELPDSFTCENCGTNKDSFILLSKTPHMWNIINPGDGCYYLDVTFDDLDTEDYPDLCTHYCFNITKEDAEQDHIFDTQYQPGGNYSDLNAEYNFFDTHGTNHAMYYYAKLDAYIDSDTLEKVAAYINDLKNSGVMIADFLFNDELYTPVEAMKQINRILKEKYGYAGGLEYGYGYYQNWLFIFLVPSSEYFASFGG